MQPFSLSPTSLLLTLLSLSTFAQVQVQALAHENEHLHKRQVAAGGGAAAATQAASQATTVTTAASHVVVGTSTTVSYIVFTQTFASTALGTWAFGNVTSSGSIGLGTISGTVGEVKTKTKRAVPTPAPQS